MHSVNFLSARYINYVLKRVNMLLHFNVKPILVFDGSYLPSKAGQEERRRKYVPFHNVHFLVKLCLYGFKYGFLIDTHKEATPRVCF